METDIRLINILIHEYFGVDESMLWTGMRLPLFAWKPRAKKSILKALQSQRLVA